MNQKEHRILWQGLEPWFTALADEKLPASKALKKLLRGARNAKDRGVSARKYLGIEE